MFDKLEDILRRYEDITMELNDPAVISDQERFRKLMKEQKSLEPLIECYSRYKKCKETIEDSLLLLEEENDPDMKEMLKEELSDAKDQIPLLEQELKILLLPKDPMMTRMLLLKLEQELVEMRPLFLLLTCTEFIPDMLSVGTGKWRL